MMALKTKMKTLFVLCPQLTRMTNVLDLIELSRRPRPDKSIVLTQTRTRTCILSKNFLIKSNSSSFGLNDIMRMAHHFEPDPIAEYACFITVRGFARPSMIHQPKLIFKTSKFDNKIMYYM